MKNIKPYYIFESETKKVSTNFNKKIISNPNIPNTKSYWHGGNLEDFDDIVAHKNGRYEYGPGLYVTDHYETARKYSKGGRKLYIVTIENGTDINDVKISIDKIIGFVYKYCIGSKKKEIKKTLIQYSKNGEINAYIFNNVMVNTKALKSSNSVAWRKFLIENGIDYEIVNNAFGYGEKMCVLYNMKKIKNVQRIMPNDEIEDYEMLMDKF